MFFQGFFHLSITCFALAYNLFPLCNILICGLHAIATLLFSLLLFTLSIKKLYSQEKKTICMRKADGPSTFNCGPCQYRQCNSLFTFFNLLDSIASFLFLLIHSHVHKHDQHIPPLNSFSAVLQVLCYRTLIIVFHVQGNLIGMQLFFISFYFRLISVSVECCNLERAVEAINKLFTWCN